MLSISRLILVVAVAIALALVAGTYLLFTGFGDRMLQQSAAQHSQSLARVTYTSMYQLMNQGWKREQVEAFADSVSKSVVGMPMQIAFYRAEAVSSQYGAVVQGEMDAPVAEALRTGQARDSVTADGVRYLMPMKAKAECLGCHSQAKAGDVLGLISIRTGYQQLMGETRLHLMLVLLMLAPLPIVGALVIAALLDSRMNGFVTQLDEVIDRAEAGKTPDFNSVQVKFSEFRELLGHFKRLVKG
jgi:hypothetical protein